MQFKYYIKNTEITANAKDLIEKKLDRLSRMLNTDDLTAQVNIDFKNNAYTVEITVPVTGITILRAESTDYNLEKAIKDVVDKVVRKARKVKTDSRPKKGQPEIAPEMEEVFEEEYDYDDYDEELPEIVRTKRFAVKPMSPEEAVLQMELVGHSFFIFLDAETNEIAVVYKRKKGGYGLIEPE